MLGARIRAMWDRRGVGVMGGIEVGRGEGKEGFEVEGILLMTC